MKIKFINHLQLIAILAIAVSMTAQAQFDTNLLLNANGEAGDMTDWTVSANGGNGWHVGTDNGGVLPGSTASFATSYGWDIRSQTIDLLANGFTTSELDSAPTIAISDWVHGYVSDGSFFMNVELEDASHSVIASWSNGSQGSPLTISGSSAWTEYSTTFENYGSDLRYIVFEDGGISQNYWSGFYGPAFDGSSVTIQSAPEPSTLALAGLGGISALVMFRRRK
jgi:hypothetical protein